MAYLSDVKISHLIENQFPKFYKEEGPNFIAFMRAYYEWMEQENNIIYESRNLLNYRNVDNTIDEFLTHFQSKYLFGVPRNILGDKRLLVKNALNIYRAKGSVEGYKLLFRLLYNQDIEVYFPSANILKTSDGVWVEPKYLELSDNVYNSTLIGKLITGFASGAEAIAEGYLTYPVNGKTVCVLFISNISGSFVPNEIVYDHSLDTNDDSVLHGPRILGSVTNLIVYQGGQNFTIGDIIRSYDSSGIDTEFRVSNTATGIGTLNFSIVDGGTYYSTDATEIITRTPVNEVLSGRSGSFNIGSISGRTPITFNTDIIYFYANTTVNANDYGFQSPGLVTNVNSVLRDALSFSTKDFGTIASLTNITPGNNYTLSPTITVRDLLLSPVISGNVYFANNSDFLTGNATSFSSYLVTSNATVNTGATWAAATNATSLTMNVVNSKLTGNIVVGSLVLGNNLPTYPKYAFVSNVISNSSSANTIVTLEFYAQNVSSGSSNTITFMDSSEKYVEIFSDYPTNSLYDYRIVKGVVNNTLAILDDYPRYNGNGNILTVYIVNTGVGYSNTDVITITPNVSDPTALGANLRIRTTSLGSIYSVAVANSGSGYYHTPSLSITSPGGGSGANLIVQSITVSKMKAGYPLLATAFGGGISNGISVNLIRTNDNSIGGLNSLIIADAAQGTGIISEVQVKNSGFGFNDNEFISFGKYGSISNPVIYSGGLNYSNSDQLIFAGGGFISPAQGEIITNTNGTIVNTNMIYYGSGYQTSPNIRIRSANGSGANLYADVGQLDTTYAITATPVKTGVGTQRGRWLNTRGFLNSDQKIQDSYYYQNYSYEIRASASLDRYASIVKNIFHLAGTELFGKTLMSDYLNSNSSVISESVTSS